MAAAPLYEMIFGDSGGMMMSSGSLTSVFLAASVLTLALGYLSKVLLQPASSSSGDQKYPPYIPSRIPFLGHAVAFGKSPIEFLEKAYEKYGPVVSFTMVGKTFTFLLGSDAAALMFNSKNEDLSAEDVYSKITTPVFGKGVAYDVPNPEIRSLLNEKVAQLYCDLDGGFSHEAWLLPSWVPLPSFRRRDQAHREIKNMFYTAIQKRRTSNEKVDDFLQTLIDATYKDGHTLSDDEIAGLLIGLLLAGQHTSSTTSTWMSFFLARDKQLQERCLAEQKAVCGEDLPPLNFDQLKELSLLDRCLKETLRLRPPIMTMMRMARSPQCVAGYTIPVGHQVCVSPTVNHRLPDAWTERDEFNPDRFLTDNAATGEKFAYVPFGAGRHRCIGEGFAYVQLKTILSTLIRKFEFDLVDGYFPTINFTTMIHTPNNPVIRYRSRTH
ncbi:hypothetical protein CRUP_019826 [Coryphaenoides rupestris]|nr:hypothetical protein CRUP_019826 [Coryphaenoides rupestris]